MNMMNMPREKKPVWRTVLNMIPLVALAVFVTIFVLRNGVSTIDALVESFSEHPWITAAAFMGLFLLKSISFGLPFTLLYIGAGNIFPLGWALVVNVCGIVVNMQIPYLLGRFSGGTAVERLLGKFPKLGKFEAYSKDSALLFTFMVKFVGKVPHEITNALLGSLKIPYLSYMVGGVLGLLPTMVATTLVGKGLDNPDSPLFIISIVVVVMLLVVSLLLYRRQIDC